MINKLLSSKRYLSGLFVLIFGLTMSMDFVTPDLNARGGGGRGGGGGGRGGGGGGRGGGGHSFSGGGHSMSRSSSGGGHSSSTRSSGRSSGRSSSRSSGRSASHTSRSRTSTGTRTGKTGTRTGKAGSKTGKAGSKTGKAGSKTGKAGSRTGKTGSRSGARSGSRNASAFRNSSNAYRCGIASYGGFGWGLGFGLGFGFGAFWNPWGGFWGPYSAFGFGWGAGWFYPDFGFWYSPVWSNWYMPLLGAWYFPYDYAWYYPTQNFYVNLYPADDEELESHIIVTNDEAPSLYYAIYTKEETGDNILFTQKKDAQRINHRLRINLDNRDPNDVLIISQNEEDLLPVLNKHQAADLSAIQLDSVKKQEEPGTPPAKALRFADLDEAKKQELRDAALQMEAQDTSKGQAQETQNAGSEGLSQMNTATQSQDMIVE